MFAIDLPCRSNKLQTYVKKADRDDKGFSLDSTNYQVLDGVDYSDARAKRVRRRFTVIRTVGTKFLVVCFYVFVKTANYPQTTLRTGVGSYSSAKAAGVTIVSIFGEASTG